VCEDKTHCGVQMDKLDTRILKYLLRVDLAAECYVPSRDLRLSRTLISSRSNITREQTRIKNRTQSLLGKYDGECEYDDIFGVRWLHTLQLNGHDDEITSNLAHATWEKAVQREEGTILPIKTQEDDSHNSMRQVGEDQINQAATAARQAEPRSNANAFTQMNSVWSCNAALGCRLFRAAVRPFLLCSQFVCISASRVVHPLHGVFVMGQYVGDDGS